MLPPLILKAKRALGLFLSRNKMLGQTAVSVNNIIFHWDKRQQDKSFGSLNPGLRFCVLRPSGTVQGLLSMYLGIVRSVHNLIQGGFIPVIDWQNYRTQYNVDFPVSGTLNAWEYYFEQPSSHTLGEVYQSRNVRLSGWTLRNSPPPQIGKTTHDMMGIVPVKKYILDIADAKSASSGINDMIGVLARGTDYTKLKPKGHPVSPSPETIAAKTDEFLTKYGQHRIFLATEDADIHDYFTQRYGSLIFTTDNNIIRDYSSDDYIASQIHADNMYQFGLDYLVKMLCLARCKYLIASKTAGSSFARLVNNGSYEEDYMFDLGVY